MNVSLQYWLIVFNKHCSEHSVFGYIPAFLSFLLFLKVRCDELGQTYPPPGFIVNHWAILCRPLQLYILCLPFCGDLITICICARIKNILLYILSESKKCIIYVSWLFDLISLLLPWRIVERKSEGVCRKGRPNEIWSVTEWLNMDWQNRIPDRDVRRNLVVGEGKPMYSGQSLNGWK